MTQQATIDIVAVLQKLANGGRIEVKGKLGERPGAITVHRVRVGNIGADTIRTMLGDGLLYSEEVHTQTHFGITQKGREALARSN